MEIRNIAIIAHCSKFGRDKPSRPEVQSLERPPHKKLSEFFEPDGSIASRLRRKMSQGDICRAINMDRNYMSAIEGGKVNVTIAVLEKLANAPDVSVDELLK